MTGPRLYTRDLVMMLHDLFPGAPVTALPWGRMNKDTLSACDLLVLPGVVGGRQPVPPYFFASSKGEFLNALERGLIVWSECAATYFLFSGMEYHTRKGGIKREKGLAVFEGKAIGPAHRHKTRAGGRGALPPQNDIVLARVFEARAQEFRVIDINGPALYPDHSDTRPFLHYDAVPDRPAAGVQRIWGRGLALGISVHPEIGPGVIGAGGMPLAHLFRTLCRHDHTRRALQRMLKVAVFRT